MKVLKKVMAVLAVLVVVALYVAVVLCAVFIKKVGTKVFMLSIVAAILLPLLLYLFFWLYRMASPKEPLEEEIREAKSKKGFQEAAVFNKGISVKTKEGEQEE